MDSILIVNYSFSGVSRRVAQLLASHYGWPMGEITTQRPRSGGSGNLSCALDSLLRRHPRIRYQGPEPGDFRTVVLISPIWMWRLAGPMRSFVHERRDALQRVAVVSTMGSSGASNAVAEIAFILGHAPIESAAFTQNEVEDGSGTGRILAFGESLQPASTHTQVHETPAWVHSH